MGTRRTFDPLPSTVTSPLRRSQSPRREAAALRDAEPGSVEHLEQREVAQHHGSVDQIDLGARAVVGSAAASSNAFASSTCGTRGRRETRPSVRAGSRRDRVRSRRGDAGIAGTSESQRPCARSTGARSLACRGTRGSGEARGGRCRPGTSSPRAHHATNSSTSCVYASRVCWLTPVSDDANPSARQVACLLTRIPFRAGPNPLLAARAR